MSDTFRAVEAPREVLKRLEDSAIKETEEEDDEYKGLACKCISEAVASSEASFFTTPETGCVNETDDMNGYEEVDDLEDDDWASTMSNVGE